ncbi:MAG: VCBS repeat-containing protein [Cyclobacteriaceae bacterium]
MKKSFNLIIALTFFFSCQETAKVETVESKIFQSLQSSQSGISFKNVLNENDTLNYFTYGYMYMGGGVAIGDINNDGLSDVYLTGNMVENKLYLNEGNLNFKDITTESGTAGDKRWMTGVTMADVNSDGWLDIYVSVAGKTGNKKNILYINQGTNNGGVPKFKDETDKYGLADGGQSTQSTFFDYDMDGDLDLYVANYPITDFKAPNFFYSNQMKHAAMQDSDHLYRNNGDDTFTNVTADAGVLNFGLSLSATVSDFNQDGYPDVYVSNDFASPDYMYFNNGDGTFTEKSRELTRHISFYGMGVDLADFNNDGLIDIAQMDMTPEDNRRSKANMASMNPQGFYEMLDLGLHYQYMKNSLQINNGLNADGYPIFSDISYMSGVALTDWSWACLFADLDNDGFKDLFITNGSRRDINNKDYFKKIDKSKTAYFEDKDSDKKESQLKLVDKMPSERIDNYTFKNNGDLTFSTANEEWGISFKGFSNGAAYADLDDDGDLELIVNNIDDEVSIFENLSSDYKRNNYIKFQLRGPDENPFGLGAKISIEHDGKLQYQELTLTRGFQSSVEPIVHFGLGQSAKVDKLTIVWPDGKKQELVSLEANLMMKLNYKDARSSQQTDDKADTFFTDITDKSKIEYAHKENYYDDFIREVLLPHETSKLGPALAVADANGDGLDDFYIGGASGSSGAIYLQKADGSFASSSGEVLAEDQKSEDIGATFFDANGDGHLDLYVVSGGNEFIGDNPALQDRLYLNNGSGQFEKAKNALPTMMTSGSCAEAYDYDGDGDMDLFVGGRLVPGSYPLPAKSYILENVTKDGDPKFEDVTEAVAPGLSQAGLVTSAVWFDYNNDKAIDLAIAGEWMSVTLYENKGGKFENITEQAEMSDQVGWWFSLEAADIDNDGDQDLVAGNLGLNYKYQASPEETFDIYSSDFDKNNKLDIVLGYYYDGTQFPVRGRQCSSEQIPTIKQKFEDYNSFAEASLEGIYSDDALEGSLHYKATNFASTYFENVGDGTFKAQALPNRAQISSVNGITIEDLNNDGNPDILCAGNFYVSEVETPRNDAGIGLLMYGDGKGGFEVQPASQTGLFAPYDTRAMAMLNTPQGRAVLFANNNEAVKLFGIRSNQDQIALNY